MTKVNSRENKRLKKVDSNGVTRIYEPISNTFGAYSSDGIIRTFFKPTSSTYFERQPGDLIKDNN